MGGAFPGTGVGDAGTRVDAGAGVAAGAGEHAASPMMITVTHPFKILFIHRHATKSEWRLDASAQNKNRLEFALKPVSHQNQSLFEFFALHAYSI